VGQSTDRRGTQGGHIEEYELVDFEKADEQQTREQERKRKRDEKRRWLDEQDDMKFSHSIQFNAVPDWSSHYIAYSNLKKM
jgi:phosphate transporter